MRRYELTDEAWLRIEPLLPSTNRPGGQWNDHRITLNGMFWILNSGSAWRNLPERYGIWQSIYRRYMRWTCEGLFDRILKTLRLQLDEEGYIDHEQFNIDGTSIRVEQSAAGARKKRRSRKSLTIMDWEEDEGVGQQASSGNRWQRHSTCRGANAGPEA